jgi:hypothetical protein
LALVLGLAIGVPLVVAAVVLALVLRRKVHAVQAAVARELEREPAVRGPESAVYRGSTGAYPKVFGNGVVVLTASRLVFHKFVGAGVDVPLAEVTGVRTTKAFNGSVVGNRVHLVVETRAGEVGYFVGDTEAWVKVITAAVSRARDGDTLPG